MRNEIVSALVLASLSLSANAEQSHCTANVKVNENNSTHDNKHVEKTEHNKHSSANEKQNFKNVRSALIEHVKNNDVKYSSIFVANEF